MVRSTGIADFSRLLLGAPTSVGILGHADFSPRLVAASPAETMIKVPGPILFKQHRYGTDGQELEVLKFHTTRVCEDGPNFPQTPAAHPLIPDPSPRGEKGANTATAREQPRGPPAPKPLSPPGRGVRGSRRRSPPVALQLIAVLRYYAGHARRALSISLGPRERARVSERPK